jgi:hypothetical protein
MPKPAIIPSTTATLAAAAAVIGAFRAGLERSGYPFREPPDTRAVLRDLDALLHPDELKPAYVWCKHCQTATHRTSDCKSTQALTESLPVSSSAPKYGRAPAL